MRLIIRLEDLKNSKFLTQRVFKRISENLHYEILKFNEWKDLLEIRSANLGGYQSTSNKILRGRIRNYIQKIIFSPPLHEEEDLSRNIQVLFEQTGEYKISASKKKMGDDRAIKFIKCLKLFPQISELNLSKFVC